MFSNVPKMDTELRLALHKQNDKVTNCWPLAEPWFPLFLLPGITTLIHFTGAKWQLEGGRTVFVHL